MIGGTVPGGTGRGCDRGGDSQGSGSRVGPGVRWEK